MVPNGQDHSPNLLWVHHGPFADPYGVNLITLVVCLLRQTWSSHTLTETGVGDDPTAPAVRAVAQIARIARKSRFNCFARRKQGNKIPALLKYPTLVVPFPASPAPSCAI